jgi:CheY-like chemotaxis protein
MLLADEGHTVETAGSGDEALAKLATFAAELLLTDVGLPGMSGLELVRRARQASPRLRAIFMTGREPDGRELAALEAECVGKPVDFADLLRRIERAR